jgi:hypothetical protein
MPPIRGSDTHASPEEALSDLQQRYTLLVGDRNAYFETSSWSIRQQKELLANLKRWVLGVALILTLISTLFDAMSTL